MPISAIHPPRREPRGRRQRPTVDRLREMQNESREKVMSTVLAQPHRKGDDDARRVSALGRFCQRMKCRREILDAAEDYAKLKKWWGAAVGKPRGFENATPTGSGEGPSEKTVRGWLSTITGVDIMVQGLGAGRLATFQRLVIDDIDPFPNAEVDALLVTTLRLVAIHLGRMSGRHSAFG